MVLKTMARAATKAAVKAASNPLKTARAIDKGISKAAKVGKKINNIIDERSYKKYTSAAIKADKAIGAYKNAKGPVERAVLKNSAKKAMAKVNREEKRDSRVADTVYRVHNRLSKYSK